MHGLNAAPSRWLVHALHTPTPQPYFGPVTPSRSRSTQSSGSSAARRRRWCVAPLRVKVKVGIVAPQPAIGKRRGVVPVARAYALATAAAAAGNAELARAAGLAGRRHDDHVDVRRAVGHAGEAVVGEAAFAHRAVVDVQAGVQRHREPVDEHALHLRLEPARVDRPADVDRAHALRHPRAGPRSRQSISTRNATTDLYSSWIATPCAVPAGIARPQLTGGRDAVEHGRARRVRTASGAGTRPDPACSARAISSTMISFTIAVWPE